MKSNNTRILAKNLYVSNDTIKTGLNNNDLIIGPSGSGKTGGYVIPNILQYNTSMVVADTKGNLCKKLTPSLVKNGYQIFTVDFVNPENSSAYNPLDYIRRDEETGKYREQDVMTITNSLVSNDHKDPFWSNSAKVVVNCLIGFVLEAFPREEQNLFTVVKVYNLLTSQLKNRDSENANIRFLEEWALKYPESFAVQKYKMFKGVLSCDRTWSCITQFVTNALTPFEFEEAKSLFAKPADFRIEELGQKKTVVFLNVSDCNRAFDGLINLFYTQALQALIGEADRNSDSRLKVPVRLILDDFATNALIPDFDKTISVIRSREISVSIILQSLSQLNAMYGMSAATIVNNCDHILYLGGVDLETTNYISQRVSKTVNTIMDTPIDKVWVLERGKRGVMCDRMPPYSIKIETPVKKQTAAKEPAKRTGPNSAV